MKPYTTAEITASGKKLLRFQIEGAKQFSLWNLMYGNYVNAYCMPVKHGFDAAWRFQLIFEKINMSFEFSSAFTQIKEWQEVGSLNILVVKGDADNAVKIENFFLKHPIPPFFVEKIEKLIYEDDDVISECGIVLSGADGTEITIAAGVSPGSVSIAAPFATAPFDPEFSIEDYKRESMTLSS